MIEQIIQWYLHDEEMWMKYGDKLDVELWEAAKPELSKSFSKEYMRNKGFHDWTFISFSASYYKNKTVVAIDLDDGLSNVTELCFTQCEHFWVDAGNSHNKHFPPSPPQVSIMCFEKKKDFIIGIGLTNGQIIYLSCKRPVIIIKKHKRC